jgi:predicted dehydrogenase
MAHSPISNLQSPPATLRVGILGAARIAPWAVIGPARRLPRVEVAAVAARDPARALAFSRRHAIPRVHTSYAGLLADPAIDVVYNPLPNSLHAEWSLRALEAGKHVLCEKPIANNAAEAEQLAQSAEEAQAHGLLLGEAFHYRYHPLAQRMKEVVTGGEIGALRRIEVAFLTPMLRRDDIRLHYELGGGALMDLGCYAVNLLRFLAGEEPEVVQATARLWSPGVDRAVRGELRFPGGVEATLHVALKHWGVPRVACRVEGTQGELRVVNFVLPHLFHRVELRTAAGRRRESFSGETTYFYQLQAFAQAARGEGAFPTDAADGLRIMRVVDALYRAAGLPLRGMTR